MPDLPYLVLYATSYGQTRKIAQRIAERLEAAGRPTELHDVKQSSALDLGDYGAVVVGGSIRANNHARALVRWMRTRAEALSARPTAVFSVSLSASDSGPEGQRTAQGYIDELLSVTGVTPAYRAVFAGDLPYRRYNVLIRFMMRRIARKHGLPTDGTVDVELTDWDAVDRFADELVGLHPA